VLAYAKKQAFILIQLYQVYLRVLMILKIK